VRALVMDSLALHAEDPAKRVCARGSSRCAFEWCRRTVNLRYSRGFCRVWAVWAVGVSWVRGDDGVELQEGAPALSRD
jgi:hypothetical protein